MTYQADREDNPYAGWTWEELRALILDADRRVAVAETVLRQERAAMEAEQAHIKDQRASYSRQAEQARQALKRLAIANYAAHNELGKTWGGVRLQERPKVIIHDARQAVMLLDGLEATTPDGEVVPVVTYEPRINLDLVKQLIQSAPAGMPAANGWPGIITLTTRDEIEHWTLGVEKEEGQRPT